MKNVVFVALDFELYLMFAKCCIRGRLVVPGHEHKIGWMRELIKKHDWLQKTQKDFTGASEFEKVIGPG